MNGSGSSGSSSFFENGGAVGGTFAAVGIVAILIICGIAWFLYRRRKAQRMDADVAMAASAAAATTRTPFDDDDPEMVEDPAYGAAGAGGAGASSAGYHNNGYYATSNPEYEPSHFSSGTAPGFAGMGAYGAAAGAGGAGAAAAYNNYYNEGNSQGHYYDNPGQGAQDYYPQSQEEHAYSQGTHPTDEYGNAIGYGYPVDQQQQHQHQHQQHMQQQHEQPQEWLQPGRSPPLDGEGMPFATGAVGGSAARRRSAGMTNGHENELLGPNVFADVPSPEGEGASNHLGEADNRLDHQGLTRAHDQGSASSLRDDQDYSRRVLSVKNQD